MSEKLVSAECLDCESTFEIAYVEEMVSDPTPNFCPFCGEKIEDISEEYIEDDNFDENTEWD
jgi:DNA-directed RNA polymerase subunit RPC12/RpoP